MTEGIHTGELERVHSLYTKYVPKRKTYTMEGMQARLHLAAVDHNLSVHREQSRTEGGQLRFKLQFSISAKDYVVKSIREAKNHGYRAELLKGVLDRCMQSKSPLL